ncbi:hypothetical protein ACFFPL_11870 [Paeniglutamicibacter sulfureus]
MRTMILRSPAKKVEGYFSKHRRASLVLPDGWYGRPFDSLFSLTLAEDTANGLRIELEGGRQLIFQGDLDIVKTGFEKFPALKLDRYRSFSWWPHDGISEERKFGNSGPVFFVS